MHFRILFVLCFFYLGEKGLVYALDINPDSIAYIASKARKKGIKNVKAIVAKAEETSLPPESVDIVFLHLVLHNIEDKHATIKEFNRILKADGKLVINEESVIPLKLIKKLAEDSSFIFSKRLRRTAQIFEKIKTVPKK